jgi:hypothetical protein
MARLATPSSWGGEPTVSASCTSSPSPPLCGTASPDVMTGCCARASSSTRLCDCLRVATQVFRRASGCAQIQLRACGQHIRWQREENRAR